MKSNYTKMQVTVNGEEMSVYKVDYDVNGNPRFVVHFLAIGVQPFDYGKIPNLTKYRAKWFGGGYVFYSYQGNVQKDVQWMMDQVKAYYKKLGLQALKEAQNMTDDELLKELKQPCTCNMCAECWEPEI